MQRDALYPDAAEAAPNLVFIADAGGKILRVNSHWFEYTGISAERIAVERDNPLGLVHADDLDATWAAWERSLASGEPFEISYRLRAARDGRYRWFLARALPFRDENGTIVRWVGAATEIDAQVRAIERSRFLSEAATALSSSFDRRRIIDDFMRLAVSRFCDGCVISLRDDRGKLQRVGIVHRDPEIERRAVEKAKCVPLNDSNPVAQVVRTKRAILIPDVADTSRDGARNAAGVEVAGLFVPTHSVIVVPLLIADRVGGTISFMSSNPLVAFDDLDLEAAEAVARHAAVALENAKSFERERETTERLRFLAAATDELFASRDPHTNFENLMRSLVGEFADWAILYVLDPSGMVRVAAVSHRDPAFSAVEELRGQHLFAEAGERRFAEIVSKRRSSLRTDMTPEVLEEFIQPFLMPVVRRLHPQSLLVVPLFSSDVNYGALGVYLSARNYTDADRELFEELGRRASLGLEHARSLSRERRLVQTLQEVILPSQLPALPNATLSTVYATATTSDAPVGGDWYDAFDLGEGRFVLSIGDVTGRGLKASAIMGKLRHAINVIAMYEPDPARILDVAERVVLQRYPDAIVTAFVTLFDTRERTIRYANAGHPYPQLRLWDGTVEPLVAGGMQIGLRSMASPAESHQRGLDDVAMLAFYTDGVTEATRDLEQGESLLQQAISSDAVLYVRAPAALISATCLKGGPHSDDAAMMVLGFPRSIGWSFDAENAKAAQDARGAFLTRLREEATDDSDLGAAEIIFGELVGNVVRHAPGPIDIALEWAGTGAVLHVIDRGNGFVYEKRQRVDVMREDGRGLWLVARFGLKLSIEHLPHFGTHVRVELPIARKNPSRSEVPAARRAANVRR